MCAPSPPPPPDFTGAAQAQGQANAQAARQQALINNPNVVSPYGTQNVTWSGTPDKTEDNFNAQAYLAANPDVAQAGMDPWQHYQAYGQKEGREFTPVSGAIGQTPTITQQLSPEEEALYQQSTQIRQGLGNLAIQGTNALGGIVGTGVDFSGMPGMPGSAEDTRTKVINAMMSRVDEDTANRRDQLNSSLVAAGIRPGTKAYDDQMAMVDRAYNDARNQAFLASGQEASRDFGMDAERRRAAIGEYLTQRQVPLNEISALRSGSQVNNPFSMPGYAQNAQVGAAPIFQGTQLQGDWEGDLYNLRAMQAGNLQSGLFGLGGAGIMGLGMLSDRRLKTNIIRVGTHPLGFGIYDYDLLGVHERGVMADEVAQILPEAVGRSGEWFTVRYDLIGGRP